MTADKRFRLAVSGTIVALCFLFRRGLEQDPVSHVLIQLPALAIAGWIVAQALRDRMRAFERINHGGAVGALIALFTIVFWMLPRAIDAALDDSVTEALKFVSLPCLAGLPLALSWHRIHPLARGLLKANALSMLGVLAFLYTHAPVRICNNYLESDQERLGIGFLVAAIGLAIAWSLPLFTGPTAVTVATSAQRETGHA